MSPGLRRVAAAVAPEGVLLLGVVWLGRAVPVSGMLAAVSPYAAAAVYGSGALLAWRFRRTRAVLALLAVALAYPALTEGPAPASGETGIGAIGRGAAAFLLPLNLAALALLRDAGTLTPLGLVRLGLVLGQAVLVLGVDAAGSAKVEAFLGRTIVAPAHVAWTPLPQPTLAAFGVALAVLAGAVAFRPDPIRRGLLWATAALLPAAHEAAAGGAPVLYLLGAGLILAVSVVESSYALAYRDGLTGLPSRRAFNEELPGLGGRYVIAMVDVDRFKGINDRYGHDVGDQVLRMVASRLAQIEGGGKAFRYGGEEFAVVFPGKRLDEVVPHLERLRGAIEAAGFTLRSAGRPRRKPKVPLPARGERRTLAITVSIGAAERSRRLSEPELVVKAADQALYRAKEEGRNRVVT